MDPNLHLKAYCLKLNDSLNELLYLASFLEYHRGKNLSAIKYACQDLQAILAHFNLVMERTPHVIDPPNVIK